MVIDALGRHDRADLADDPRAIRRASVLSLCRRCDWREEHATAVAKLAVQLFDVTRPIHFAEEDDRELLEYAALLHDIGEHVAHEGHDRHSAYMIEHGGLRGFSPAEVSELISLARFHTRGRPRSDFPAYAALDGKRRKRVLQLLALLRMADGLDVSHREVVCSIEGQIDPDRVIFLASVSDDAELEQWIFRRKSALFEEVFGVEAVLELMLTGPAVSLFPIRAGEPEKPVGEDSERRRRTAGG
jgi:exopolyphosphatase/guanosine-5'-triphosphate,3'-diphosphate pyrophosphatase